MISWTHWTQSCNINSTCQSHYQLHDAERASARQLLALVGLFSYSWITDKQYWFNPLGSGAGVFRDKQTNINFHKGKIWTICSISKMRNEIWIRMWPCSANKIIVQIMACLSSDKPLSEPMIAEACIRRSTLRWVKCYFITTFPFPEAMLQWSKF